MKRNWTKKLINLGACIEAVKWASQYPTAQSAWDACERPDWLLWLLQRTQPPTKDIHHAYVRIACAEARLALPYTIDPRVRKCIETVEGWERGERTLAEVNAAGAASWDAARAAWAAAGAAARAAVYKQCADIVRREFPKIKL